MTPQDLPATKQDIQMILDAIISLEKDMDRKFEAVDEKFEKMDEKIEKKFEETKCHMGVLIEDLEDRFLDTSKDTFDMQADKLENHEERIVHLEKINFAA